MASVFTKISLGFTFREIGKPVLCLPDILATNLGLAYAKFPITKLNSIVLNKVFVKMFPLSQQRVVINRSPHVNTRAKEAFVTDTTKHRVILELIFKKRKEFVYNFNKVKKKFVSKIALTSADLIVFTKGEWFYAGKAGRAPGASTTNTNR